MSNKTLLLLCIAGSLSLCGCDQGKSTNKVAEPTKKATEHRPKAIQQPSADHTTSRPEQPEAIEEKPHVVEKKRNERQERSEKIKYEKAKARKKIDDMLSKIEESFSENEPDEETLKILQEVREQTKEMLDQIDQET